MNRLLVGLALVGSAYLNVAHAETQAELAAKEDENGKAAMFAGNYKQASDSFRSAADRAPEAKYYFHLCAELYQQGIFGQALTACNAGVFFFLVALLLVLFVLSVVLFLRVVGSLHIDLAL